MILRVAAESPDTPEIAALLAASDAYSAALYPPESRHGPNLAALLRSEVTFLVARRDGHAIGCGALVAGARRAELKRMFVADAVRGLGVGRAVLTALEAAARAQGIALVQLETGVASHGALALYRRAGYVERGPFGAYRADPLSIFMEKQLDRGGT